MQISHTVKLEIERSAEAVYDFVTAVETPTKVFSGYGPIPAVIETTVVGGGPLLEGSICRTRNSDGSMMNRTISVLERPRRHQYVVDGDGFRPLFRMMVRRGPRYVAVRTARRRESLALNLQLRASPGFLVDSGVLPHPDFLRPRDGQMYPRDQTGVGAGGGEDLAEG